MLLEITIIVTVSYLIIFGAFATIIQMHQEMLAAESVTACLCLSFGVFASLADVAKGGDLSAIVPRLRDDGRSLREIFC